jgi:hypothetical protein
MSDATLPPPRSSSLAPAADAGSRSDSSSGEGEFDTSLDQSTYSAVKEEGSGDSEGRQDNKQKRKRTRYVWDLQCFIIVSYFGFLGDIVLPWIDWSLNISFEHC